jgi:hypothetical protein
MKFVMQPSKISGAFCKLEELIGLGPSSGKDCGTEKECSVAQTTTRLPHRSRLLKRSALEQAYRALQSRWSNVPILVS